MMLKFQWDEKKAKINLQKHSVSFEEAKTVLNDELSVTYSDYTHSVDEERFIDIGMSEKGRLLVVVYTEREGSIRIISAREATKYERRYYEEGR